MSTFSLRIVFVWSALFALSGCTDIEMGCASTDSVIPLCGVQMPEDIEVLPNEGGLLIGEFGEMGKIPGALTWYQPGPDAEFVRLVDSSNITIGSSKKIWGQPNCPVPGQLSPHGIHLASRGDTLQLLVVNHDEYEQVLYYEVYPGDGASAPSLAWRGCVTFPELAVLNDVVALPAGGLAVTHMYDREYELLAQLKSSFGLNDGHVWIWFPSEPPQVLANSEAKMPNGIEVAEDGESIWVNNYIEQEVRQYDIATSKILTRISVPNIDNSAWLPDGRLLVASHLSPLTMLPCFGVRQGSCGAGYELIAVDTNAGTTEVIFHSDKGGPFGPATVAVPYRGKLYAGSFSGDRMAEITLDE